jgi:hypothetical protein
MKCLSVFILYVRAKLSTHQLLQLVKLQLKEIYMSLSFSGELDNGHSNVQLPGEEGDS